MSNSSDLKPIHEKHDRLFCGCYPGGLVWADRDRLVGGDYRRLAFMSYETLELQLEGRVPEALRARIVADAAEIQAKRGQSFQIAGNMSVILGGKQ